MFEQTEIILIFLLILLNNRYLIFNNTSTSTEITR